MTVRGLVWRVKGLDIGLSSLGVISVWAVKDLRCFGVGCKVWSVNMGSRVGVEGLCVRALGVVLGVKGAVYKLHSLLSGNSQAECKPQTLNPKPWPVNVGFPGLVCSRTFASSMKVFLMGPFSYWKASNARSFVWGGWVGLRATYPKP